VAASAPAKIWPPKVLLVLPSKDFFFPDYMTVRNQLSDAGVTCVMAAPTWDEVPPLAVDFRHKPIKPEALVARAKAADYSAIYFGGGSGMADYFYDGPLAHEAKRLIQEALAAKRLVAALGRGPRVLADAGALKGARATCFQHSQPPGLLVATLQKAGAVFVDAPAVTDGLFVTGRNPDDTLTFIKELRQQLGVP
jgi:protease I